MFGQPWTLGLDDYLAGRIDAQQMALNVLLRVIAPVLALAATVLGVAWRWGRLYCGWLCPHFSVVETINQLVRKASGKQSIWDRKAGPPGIPTARRRPPMPVTGRWRFPWRSPSLSCGRWRCSATCCPDGGLRQFV